MGWFGKLPITHVMFIYSSQIAGGPKTIFGGLCFSSWTFDLQGDIYIYVYIQMYELYIFYLTWS